MFFFVQLSSVIPDINHPQVVSIFLGGIPTIPKWYVLYYWVSHMSPLVFECFWCRYPETASHMAWSFLGIQPISGRSFLEIPWFFASPFLEDVPWKHHWITIKWEFPPYHGCFTIKPPFLWGFPTANRQLNPPIDTWNYDVRSASATAKSWSMEASTDCSAGRGMTRESGDTTWCNHWNVWCIMLGFVDLKLKMS